MSGILLLRRLLVGTVCTVGFGCSSQATLAEWCRDVTTVHIAGLSGATAEFTVGADDFEVRCSYDAANPEGRFDCEGTSESGVQGSISELWFYAPFTSSMVQLVAKDTNGFVVAEALEVPKTETDQECGRESRSASVTFELDSGASGSGGASGSAALEDK